MYTSFHIKNFRCFEDLDFNDLARINLIGGRNNVGKTALLEAILLHRGRYDAVLARLEAHHPDWPPYPEKIIFVRARDWKNLFFGLDASRTISISGTYSRVDENQQQELFADDVLKIQIVGANQLDEGELKQLGLSKSSLERTQILQFDSERKQRYHMVRRDNYVSHYVKSTDTVFLPANKQMSVKENADRFRNVKRQGKTSLLSDILKIIEPRISDIELLYGLYANVEGLGKPIPLENMGEGLIRIASAILAIIDTPNGVVLIDDMESGLHYSILPDIWRAIAGASEEFNTQIFATTHSLETIRAAHEAFKGNGDYDFRYHRLDRDPDTGNITAMTYDQDLMEAATDLAYEVR